MANDNMIQIPFIALSIVLPLLGLACLAYFQDYLGRRLALVFSGLSVICIIGALYIAIASGTNFVAEQYSYYIPALSVLLNLRLDPISFALSLMAGIVAFVALLSGNTEQEHEKLAGSLILLFQASAMGLFAAGNLFLFFIFWDVGVVAMFFMLYMLGSANRRRAAMKFLLYELLASLFLLLAIMMIYFYTPLHSFDIQYIIQNSQLIPTGTQLLIFFFLFAAFLINMPVFPVHLWLPDAHTEASTQGSMLLSGALTKFGGYGMILTFFMLPMSSQFSVFIAILATFSAFYAAFVLMTVRDIKRIVAYTTIVEMSIILLAIASQNGLGIAGATFGMLAHGFTISLLFLAAGSTGHMFGERDIRVLRGVVKNAFETAYTFLTGVFATTGVPLTAAFIGDVLIFMGALQAFSLFGIIPLIALLLTGTYLYYVINKSFLSTKEVTQNINYIGASQRAGYLLLIACIFFFGIAPFIILNLFNV